MALAREELGPEAMLVQSKRTSSETRHFGLYEVVFALQEPQSVPVITAPPPVAPPTPAFAQVFASEQRDSAIQKLSLELDQLKQRLESMSGIMKPGEMLWPGNREQKRTNPMLRALLDADIQADIAETLARDPGQKSLGGFVRVDATLGVPNASRRIVALVGPPGAGKTTTLVKLATRYGLTARRGVHLISTDVYRVGAAEQLRLYASILGVAFQTVDTPLMLAQILEEQRQKDLIFIDTPGWGSRDIPEIQELASYIAGDPDIDVHLVLPASNRSSDLERIADRYAIFNPRKLLFTRIDETGRYGSLVNESHRLGKPLSFFSTGEQIPEDLEPATLARVAELALGSSLVAEHAAVREESN